MSSIVNMRLYVHSFVSSLVAGFCTTVERTPIDLYHNGIITYYLINTECSGVFRDIL